MVVIGWEGGSNRVVVIGWEGGSNRVGGWAAVGGVGGGGWA